MKKIIKIVFSSILLLILLSFILAIVLTGLSLVIKNETTLNTIKEVLSLLLYFFIATYIGKQVGFKGIIVGIIIALLYVISAFIIFKIDTNLLSISLIGTKVLTIISGAIIGVNLS